MEDKTLGVISAQQYAKDRMLTGKRTIWLGNNEVVTYFTKHKTLQCTADRFQFVKVTFLNDADYSINVIKDNILEFSEINEELNSYDKVCDMEEISVKKQQIKRKSRFRMKEE